MIRGIFIILYLVLLFYLSDKYMNCNATKFINKIKNYNLLYHEHIPIPKRDPFSLSIVEFSISNPLKKLARNSLKQAKISDLKDVNVKDLAIASLVALSPDDEIDCKISDNIKIISCKKVFTFSDKELPLKNSVVQKVLNLPDSMFEINEGGIR